MGDALTIWAVTDGRAGNEAQALGLAEAIARARPAEIAVKRLTLKPAWAFAPAQVWSAASGLGGLAAIVRGLDDGGAQLAEPWPDLAIGAGRRAAPFVAALRSSSGARVRAVQLLDPQTPTRRFDLVVAPAHDRLSGPNVRATLGSLNRIDPNAVVDPDPRLTRLPRPLTAVLVGGASKSARFEEADLARLIDAIAAAGATGGVAVTASRRTPDAYQARLAEAVTAVDGFYWDGAGENPYRAMLAAADALIVTADSVNMCSEAATLGKPLRIAPLSRLSPKLQRFHAALEAGGHARPLDADMAGWTPTALDDASTVVATVLDLIDSPRAAGPA